jgi:A/G-specific adenine glycosylase
MEIGAVICLPNGPPLCAQCPAAEICLAKRNDMIGLLPNKKAKAKRRIEKLTVFILNYDDELAIIRRDKDGLLKGMWALPNVEGHLSSKDAFEQAESWRLSPAAISEPTQQKHIFTHVEWKMRCYAIACTEKSTRFTWVHKKELDESFALPTAFKKLFVV